MSKVVAALREAWDSMGDLPIVARHMMRCAVVVGLLGGLVGLALGLAAYPPTAWFAVLEVGAPATALGAAIGLFVGLGAAVVDKVRSPPP